MNRPAHTSEESSMSESVSQTAPEQRGYTYAARFIGDFEVFLLEWVLSGHTPEDAYHEVWLPVRERP